MGLPEARMTDKFLDFGNMEQYTSQSFTLTAGECNAQGLMPVGRLVERVIVVATEHANRLGIGYARLNPMGIAWVLSRVSVEMKRWPGINDMYSLTTWIEGFTRFYSDRCFRIDDGQGNAIGYVRTVWVAIDIAKRAVAELGEIADPAIVNHELVCPVPKQGRIRPVAVADATKVEEYTFRFSDIDFNRHVNSVRYIEHILNMWPMEFYDRWCPEVFEITYAHECLFGQTVTLAALETQTDSGTPDAVVDILANNTRAVAAHLRFRPF